MAFQQSTRQPVQRLDRTEPGHVEPAAVDPQDRPTPNEFQKWVVFTPGTDAGTTSSYLNTTQDDQVTPGRSRISDLGSLDTVARSEFDLQAASEVISGSVAEEDAELDSLDSHLPEFRIVPSPYNQPEVAHAAPVLPGHDGLGSFRFETPGMSAEAQDRMYAFERFNPNRVGHRSEGFNLAQLETQTEEAQDWERNHRIEAWRLEQSQLLLEDIRNETRKRQQSEESLRDIPHTKSMKPEVAERSVADDEAADINLSGADWHDQDEPTRSGAKPGSWSQMARKFIRDMMGVDDELLAVLFGDAVPDEEMLSSPPGRADRYLVLLFQRGILEVVERRRRWKVGLVVGLVEDNGLHDDEVVPVDSREFNLFLLFLLFLLSLLGFLPLGICCPLLRAR